MRFFAWIKSTIRGYFFAGLLVIVPLGVTLFVITAILRLIDRLLTIIPPKFHPETYLPFKIPGLGLVLAIVLIMITGILVKNYIGRRVVDFGESILSGIPLVRPVYVAVKQVIQAMFGDTPYAFKRAILVEYPRKGVWALAFVTGRTYEEIAEKTKKKTINVFLPTTPNPTSGFYLVIPEEDTIPLDITVEDAFKLLISGGVVEPGGRLPQFLFGRKQRNARMEQILAQSGQPKNSAADSVKSNDQSENGEENSSPLEDRSIRHAGNSQSGADSEGKKNLTEN
jgi:uncharacterized membrane protein